MKKLGRPPKPKGLRKGKRLELRLTDAEHRKLAAKAKAAGVSVSEYLRNVAIPKG